MDGLMMFIVPVLVLATFAMIGLGIMQLRSQQQVQARVASVEGVLASSSSSSVSQSGQTKRRQSMYTGTFSQRVLLPMAQQISEKIQFIVPLSGKSWIRQKLIQAGYDRPSHFKTYIGIHCMTAVGVPALMAFMLFAVGGDIGMTILFVGMFGFMGFFLPIVWLIQQAGKRQTSIRKALPDFLDLLVICVEAGLGLDQAIQKITKIESVQTSEFLKDELIRYSKEISFGKSRKEALMGLATRTGVDDLNAVINALVQAYEMGTGVVTALRVQSETLRTKRLHRAEEAANKISVKMVLPIYLFFFPGIFVVILGPLVLSTFLQISQQMQTTSLQ